MALQEGRVGSSCTQQGLVRKRGMCVRRAGIKLQGDIVETQLPGGPASEPAQLVGEFTAHTARTATRRTDTPHSYINHQNTDKTDDLHTLPTA